CNDTPPPLDVISRVHDFGSTNNNRKGLMIEPPKATKGRRMLKTRKKSSKPSSSHAARAKSAARAKTKITDMSSAATKKSRKSAASTASHKAASKRLKSSDSTGRPISPQASPPREKAPALVEG